MNNLDKRNGTFNLAIAAAVTALGVTIPVIFHAAGIGQIFMPMFIPLAVGAFLLSPKNSLLAGAATPLVSAILTGMPPFYPPIALVMIPELALFCFIISYLSSKTALPRFTVLLAAAAADRLFVFMAYYYIYPLLGISSILSFANLFKGLPGLAVIVIAVPLVSSRLESMLSRSALSPFEYLPETERESENAR